ncbi:1,2-phenylacetyl-CoA epoxidase subunit PaaC [Piscinibacter koreensis]|uniref:1,2-phenylacetyl-CoA epoxidase subunit PaaC n=1 Tax=Piscinibacter koreensis TaxID=2742824 RepID=UPI001FE721AA|nr:1,2-phenylacetyl-CoA epoxidase subunit PaaC [Schlegelella koreensis]
MSSSSIAIADDPAVRYLLRIGDTCLVHAQRLAEWSGHAPMLEEDIAMSNIALDLLGQARAVLTRAGQVEAAARGVGSAAAFDEDQLAFLRDERDFVNVTLAELPRGDFASTMLRAFMLATFFRLLWERLDASSDAELAAIAGKAVKEARYHQQHAGDWVVRLGDGTPESARRMQRALDTLWPYVPELFEADAVDAAAAASGLGPNWADLETSWRAEVEPVLGAADLSLPAPRAFRSTGKAGRHSEHMGYLLAEMQHLQRAFPGGVW